MRGVVEVMVSSTKTTMAYTVKQVAGMSGVSVRTLHFYDEVGLLKPAYHGGNGYRFYEEAQLLTLQQILFYRELGFELKEIQRVIRQPDFDRIAALKSHQKALRKNVAHTQKLIRTIDKTIQHLKGMKKMKSRELFVGFSPEQQAKNEQYLIERFGEGMKKRIARSKARVKNWTKGDWMKSGAVFDAICRELVAAMGQGEGADSAEVQAIIRKHFEWIKQFWTPNRESYAGHSQMIVDSELRQAYEKYDAALPEFIAAGIGEFAERELS